MKNKLLVSVFAVTVAAFAFTSCEKKSNVIDVCSDMVKKSIHESARSLLEVNEQTLTITEIEFPSADVNDKRMVCRTVSFGNQTPFVKQEEAVTFEYGNWNEDNTAYSLLVTPSKGEPYTIWYRGNSLVMPDGRKVGGEGTDNSARVEKLSKVVGCLPNTKWEGRYEGEFVLDSVFRDSIRTRFIPPMTYITDTIQVFDRMDTVSADTSCNYILEFYRDATTYANTGHFYRKEVRSKYDKKTQSCDTVSMNIKEYDCVWFINAFSSDSRFSVSFISTTSGVEGDPISISKFVMNDQSKPDGFLYNGASFHRLP